MVDAIEQYRNTPGVRAIRERLNNVFSHSPETESSLRDMETEKLVKILAARPGLIPMSEWQSSPEMYDLYRETRQQLGLPNNEGSIKTEAKLPEGARTPIESNFPIAKSRMTGERPRVYNPVEPSYPGNQPIRNDLRDFRTPTGREKTEVVTPEEAPINVEEPSFGASAVSPYANLQRIDETQPVATVKKQQETRDTQMRALLENTIRGLHRGNYNNPDLTTPQSVLERRMTPAQLDKYNEEVAKTKEALDFYNNPDVQNFLLSNPTALQRANGDPFAVLQMVKKEMEPKKEPQEEAGVAPVAARPSVEENAIPEARTVSPNPLQSSVGGGNEYGGANQVPIENDEMASLRELSKKYPVQAAPAARSVANTPSKPSTYTMDPLTKKAYAPVSQTMVPANYQSDEAIQRSGEGGAESATDFIRNAPIYQKRLADQAPAEARGGSIRNGGNPHDSKCHVGIIHMAVGGRTDHLPMNVYANSYVIPADVVSGLGEGNTLAGGKVLDHMFSGDSLQKIVKKTVKDPMKRADGGETAPQKKQPWDTIVMPPTNLSFGGIDYEGGPFGSKLPSIRGSSSNFGPSPYQYRWQPKKSINEQTTTAATGGMISDRQMKPVEIIAAGGEYVIPPEVVRSLGHGDAESGHKWLDNFVKSTRAHTIKTMQKLPGPKKD